MPAGDKPSDARVLVVDDDPISLGLLSRILERQGFQVSRAAGAIEARAALSHHGLREVDCVLTDYQMPVMNGVELLKWLSQQADAPAVVMVTGEGEKRTIAESLRHGATDYLEKPVDPRKLIGAVRRAVSAALHRREVQGLESAAVRIAEAQHSVIEASVGPSVQYYHRARHALGGDSVSGFNLAAGRRLYLVSDISGHDLDSAFTAAYFQGVVRGMSESGASVPDILTLCNRLLLTEWSGNRSDASISLCGIELTLDQSKVTVYRCGAPQVVYSDGEGRARPVAQGRTHPLGWFETCEPSVESIAGLGRGSLYTWTDGLEDLAAESGASPLSLVYRLLATDEGELLAARASDDVLAVRVDLGIEPQRIPEHFIPLYTKACHHGQIGEIDRIQEYWRRSLLMALPALDQSYLYDVLLCSREALLNALTHGCKEGGTARVTLSYSPLADTIRAYICDPGEGHGRDLRETQGSADSESGGRGLVLIGRMTDDVSLARRGAELTMEWAVRRAAATPSGGSI
jgi:CheY-like chemotaxis protein/anti-sigma regulatory factor (Ser/Thr protein kinase)